MTLPPEGEASSPEQPAATDPHRVRVDHQGQSLGLEWGRQKRGDVGTWAALAVIAAVICFVCVLIAGALENSNQTLADMIGFSGLGVLGVVGGGAVIGAIRANGGLKRQGRLSVDEKVIETSLRVDPYSQMRAKATDAFPQFRDHLERSAVVAVSHQRHKMRGLFGDRNCEVVAELDTGVEYVLAVGLTEGQAIDVVEELRAHLELPETGRQSVEVQSDEAVAELRDAVTEYRKGPIIGDQEAASVQDRPEPS